MMQSRISVTSWASQDDHKLLLLAPITLLYALGITMADLLQAMQLQQLLKTTITITGKWKSASAVKKKPRRSRSHNSKLSVRHVKPSPVPSTKKLKKTSKSAKWTV